jgi:hypothetical protein
VVVPLLDDSRKQFGQVVLTHEWFGGAVLSDACRLTLMVLADLSRERFHPPASPEWTPEQVRDIFGQELVSWGYTFDFGLPPVKGRWAVQP